MSDFFDDMMNPDTAQKHIRQGSEQWDMVRVGRFTSSEFHKLMTPGKRDMTPEELAARPKKGVGSATKTIIDTSILSDTARTYIQSKVAEVLTGQPRPQAYAYPLVWGKEQEPYAVEYFEKKTGLQCEEVGFQTYTNHAGGSPDRLIGDTDGLEIKCPYTSDKQIDYLMLTDHHDLKRMHPDYYYQCVTLLLFTGRDRWHFATYDDRFKEDRHKMSHIIIEKEKVKHEFDLIHKMIEVATKEKYELLKTIG